MVEEISSDSFRQTDGTGAQPHGRLVRLTIDHTTAHLTVAPNLSEQLWEWFLNNSIRCCLRPGAASCGMDVLDFGNPSRREEKRIAQVLAAWQQGHCQLRRNDRDELA